MESKPILKPNSKTENKNKIKSKKMRANKCLVYTETNVRPNEVITISLISTR